MESRLLKTSVQGSSEGLTHTHQSRPSTPSFTEFTSAPLETHREGREINILSVGEDRPVIGQQMPGKGLAGQAGPFFPFIYIMRSTLKCLVQVLVGRILWEEVAKEQRTDKGQRSNDATAQAKWKTIEKCPFKLTYSIDKMRKPCI